MNDIEQTCTILSCQFFINKEKVLIKTPSRCVDDYFSKVGGQYSLVLDGYVMDSKNCVVNIIDLHTILTLNMQQQYETMKKNQGFNKSEKDNSHVSKNDTDFVSNIELRCQQKEISEPKVEESNITNDLPEI